MLMAGEKSERARAMFSLAIAADPRGVSYYLTRAGLEMRQPTPDPGEVKADYQRALTIDPQNVLARLDYADVLIKLHDPLAAAEQYRLALATNAQYHEDEPKRLPPARVKEIEASIEKLAPSSATATQR